MSRVTLRDDLDVEVAARVVRPQVDRATARMRDTARAAAPPVRMWVTMRDERVRASHARTDRQVIPANLRFRMPSPGGGVDLARAPRDPNLPIEQRINCRCSDQVLPTLLRESIHASPAVLAGTRVVGSVYTRFARAAESEFGTSGDEPAYFMRRALDVEALRWQRP